MADETPERDPATTTAETFHRHGALDPSKWDEAEAVTDRPNDTPLRGEDKPAVPNTTFAERAKAQRSGENKAVQAADNKSLDAMTKDELLAEADRRRVDVNRSAKKADIIKALS